MAISLLSNLDYEECPGNIFSENFDKNHCSNCHNGIRSLLQIPNLKQFLQKFYTGPICSMENVSNELLLKNAAAQENLIENDADPNVFSSKFNQTDADQSKFNQKDADQSEIMAIKAELRGALLSVASKLLKDTDTRLHHLSKAEQDLWNSFEKADIYEFLTGEKDKVVGERERRKRK